MNEPLKEFIDDLTYWLTTEHGIKAFITKEDETEVELSLTTEDQEDPEFRIGNYAKPGATIKWLGEHQLQDEARPDNLIRINSIVMSALGRHVAGWIAGYS